MINLVNNWNSVDLWHPILSQTYMINFSSRNSKLTTMSIVDDFHTRAHFFSWIWPGCRLEVCRKKCLHIELLQLGIGGLESHCWLSPIKCHGFTITLLFVSCLQNIDEEMYWDVLKCEEMYWGGPEQQRLYCYAGLPTLLHWLGEGRRPMVFIKWMSMVNARTSTPNDSAKARCWNILLNPKQIVVFL